MGTFAMLNSASLQPVNRDATTAKATAIRTDRLSMRGTWIRFDHRSGAAADIPIGAGDDDAARGPG